MHNSVGCQVSRTKKDSKKITPAVLEVVNDGTFDLFLNRKLDRSRILEEWLREELCVRFGFCGEQYDSIVSKLNQNGRTTVVFG